MLPPHHLQAPILGSAFRLGEAFGSVQPPAALGSTGHGSDIQGTTTTEKLVNQVREIMHSDVPCALVPVPVVM